MKGAIILKGFIAIFLITGFPYGVLAKNGVPVCGVTVNNIAINQMQKDTIPPPKKNTESSNNKSDADVANKPASDIIKEVPKARRQTIPIPFRSFGK